jgi:multiple antibiotic resistance protein
MDTAVISLFTASFVTFFVLIDAIGVAPIFASLTMDGDDAYRRRMAFKSVLVATIIIFGFAFGGAWLLDSMHITIHAFRAAGGILLFIIALDMVFEKRTERRESRAEDVLASDKLPEDVAVFPIGIPMIAGPGTIATAMLYMSNSPSIVESAVVLAALAANLLVCLIIFLAAGPIVRALGDSFTGALTRILGVILAALSIQFLIDGIKGAFDLGLV